MDGGNRHVDSRCNNNIIMDQIMLRFRPIAPRPVTAPVSGGILPAKDVNRKRVKRKYVRVKKMNNNNNKTNLAVKGDENWFDLDRTVANLAMLEGSVGSDIVVSDPLQKVSNWISFDIPTRKGIVNNNNLLISEPAAVRKRKVVESWITVETVTGTCEDRRLLGYTDEEIWKNLETDSCPGFVSNGYDEVQWVNPAYRRMIDLGSESDAPAVWLVVKVDKSTVVKYLPAFSCRVRIEYRASEKKTPMTVPCDVCKMNSGGFAWRLDVKFALSLGPLS